MKFFDSLFLGTILIVINMGIQCSAVVILIRYLIRHEAMNPEKATFLSDLGIISFVVAVLFVGHLLQFLVWSEIFILVGEFTDRPTAFYHSIVNFSSLGYGDIVMSDEWRLLGALEACNGVLMFGLSAGTVLSIMSQLFKRYETRVQG